MDTYRTAEDVDHKETIKKKCSEIENTMEKNETGVGKGWKSWNK